MQYRIRRFIYTNEMKNHQVHKCKQFENGLDLGWYEYIEIINNSK